MLLAMFTSLSHNLLYIPFNGIDAFRDGDLLRTGARAFKVIDTGPCAVVVIDLFEPFQVLVVAGVEDESEGPYQRGRSQKLLIFIHHTFSHHLIHLPGASSTPPACTHRA